MARRIRLTIGQTAFEAELDNTRTAEAIWQALPIEGQGARWGQELYFAIPLDLPAEDAREEVARGELGYWPPGKAFCIFWGPTPASTGPEPRAASPVNVFGKVLGDPAALGRAKGTRVRVERLASALPD